jgi:hypothetical protein
MSNRRLAILTEGGRDLAQTSMKTTGPYLKSDHDRNQFFCDSRCVSGSKDYGVSKFTVLYYHVPEDEVKTSGTTNPKTLRHISEASKPL